MCKAVGVAAVAQCALINCRLQALATGCRQLRERVSAKNHMKKQSADTHSYTHRPTYFTYTHTYTHLYTHTIPIQMWQTELDSNKAQRRHAMQTNCKQSGNSSEEEGLRGVKGKREREQKQPSLCCPYPYSYSLPD